MGNKNKSLVVKIKKLSKLAVIPTYKKDGDAGLDLTSIYLDYDEKLDCYVYHTGLSIEIPKGFVGKIYPRSSNRNTNLYMPNSVGIIDSGYRGEILVCFKCVKGGSAPYCYKVGDCIAQLIIEPCLNVSFIEVDKLSETERGDGGFGHTGK